MLFYIKVMVMNIVERNYIFYEDLLGFCCFSMMNFLGLFLMAGDKLVWEKNEAVVVSVQ